MVTATQLPLALKVRQGKDLSAFISSQQPELLPLLDALLAAQERQMYLYGASGCGKSHLLEACVSQLERLGESACLVSAALLRELSPEVFDGMEGYALLAIDDVDQLAGQPEWEEALFHLYNRCLEAGGRLLFAAQQAPRQGGFQLADLVSRLGAGPVLNIKLPDENGLVALLQTRAKASGLTMSMELARYMVARASRQPNALIELVERLDRAALADKRRLTIPFVRQQLDW